MKILKYIIFISILSSLFFVIYRQSDEKGFRKWWTSFRMAAILAGLIPTSTEAVKPSVNNNQVYHERLLSEQEFNSFEDNDRQVILAKTGDSAPSVPTSPGRGQPTNFPTPPSGGRPSRNVPGVNPYRVPPKVVDQGLSGAANPAGAGNGGGAAEFDNNSPIPKKQQSQQSKTFDYDYRLNDLKNKKKLEDQCPIDQPEVNESFKSNSSLKKVTKRALGNQDVKREHERIRKRIDEGVDPMDIGRDSTDLGDGLTYVRGRHGRYLVKNDNGVKDVVGIAYRGSRNDMKTLAKEMNKSYNVTIEPGGY